MHSGKHPHTQPHSTHTNTTHTHKHINAKREKNNVKGRGGTHSQGKARPSTVDLADDDGEEGMSPGYRKTP